MTGTVPAALALAVVLGAAGAQAASTPLRWSIDVDPLARTVAVDGSPIDVGDQVLSEDGSFLTGPWPGAPAATAFTWEVEIRTPPGQVAVAPGRILVRESGADGNRVVVASDGPTDELAVFVGPYRVRERNVEGICTRTYFPAEVGELSDLYLERAAGYVARFAAAIGPPPFSCFSVVAGPLPVGLGFPGLTYVGSRVLPLPYMATTSLAHEVLHGWWGNGVRIDAREGNWAEGLTTLLADHDLAAETDPAAAREMRERWLRDYAALTPADDVAPRTFRAKRHGRAQTIGYHKVAMTLLMLRDRIGADAFAAGLRHFWTEHRLHSADWSDLRHAFATAAREPLDAFLAQWLDRPGAPALRVERAQALRTDSGWALDLVLVQDEPAFDLALPIEVETTAGAVVRTVQVAAARTAVRLPVAAEPRRLRLDPDYRVFRRLPAAAVPVTLRTVTFDPGTDVVVRYEDAARRAAALDLARALLEREARVADPAAQAAGNRIVIGPAAAVTRFPEPTAAAGTARAWAGREADGSGRLWVAAEDGQDLRAMARLLPHYGSRSWVVFNGGRAIDKGTWPVADSWYAVGALAEKR